MKNTVADSKKRAERMKDQLRRRQERGSKRAVAGVENLSDVERKQAAAITNLMTEADRTREENSLIAALKALEEVGRRLLVVAVCRLCAPNFLVYRQSTCLYAHVCIPTAGRNVVIPVK